MNSVECADVPCARLHVVGAGHLEHADGHAPPRHRHQVALHPLLARPHAAALVDQEARVLLLAVSRVKVSLL